MKIMMTGGGTLGPVTPLLAIVEAWRQMDSSVDFVWVGTKAGPEQAVVEKNDVAFFGINAPKLHRHAPLRWAGIPFQFGWSMKVAMDIVRREQPDVVVTAGGYVSVPIVWAAKLRGIPVWVHQQDVRAGLANVLMAKAAEKISCAWILTAKKFASEKTIYLGNPVRASILNGSPDRAAARYQLDLSRPTVLFMGGGTGSSWINQTVVRMVPDLVQTMNVIHLTGIGKQGMVDAPPGYIAVELIKEGMADVYALADIVVCRAGMGTISELASLSKAAMIIPMPDSHQEENCAALEELNAAVIVHQSETSPQILMETIMKLLVNDQERKNLGVRLHQALPTMGVAEEMARQIKSLAKQ